MSLFQRCLFLLLFFSMWHYSGYAADKIESTVNDQHTSEYIHELITSAASFRKGILSSYADTLNQYVSADFIPWFNKLDKKLTGTPPEMVWQRLFLDAQMLVTNIKGSPLVIYYSVWPDVYILTEWQKAGNVPVIIDAEIVSGDYFRASHPEVVASAPLWSSLSPYLLSSVARSVSTSLKKADGVFLDNTGMNWRRDAGLDNSVDNHRLLSSRSAAWENVLSNLANVFDFYNSKNADMENIRLTVFELQSMFYLELENDQYDGDVINNDVKKYLENIDRESFLDARITAVVKYRHGAWAFLTLKDRPQISLSIYLALKNNNYKIQRIEVIDYLRAYVNG